MKDAEPLQLVGKNKVRWRNRLLVHFSGCDYFRLGRDPRLAAAAKKTLADSGLNVAASRCTTGNHPIYARMEAALANFFGAPAAVVLPEGYLAPMTAAQALAGEFTHALLDEFAHGALVDAARMLGCPTKTFRHRDRDDLADKLARCGRNARPMVFTDGLFAHDGSVAPLREYLEILPPRGMILVDDAHGVGVLGASGRGTLQHTGVSRARVIQCATLSKAFGAYGGVVLAPSALRRRMISRTWMFPGTTPLPPPLAGAALAALDILRRDAARRRRLLQHVERVREALRGTILEAVETPGPIIRLPKMTPRQAGTLRERLLKAGIYPPFLKYASVSGAGCFRFVISSEHTPRQLDRLIKALVPKKREDARAAGRSFAGKENARTRETAPRPSRQ